MAWAQLPLLLLAQLAYSTSGSLLKPETVFHNEGGC